MDLLACVRVVMAERGGVKVIERHVYFVFKFLYLKILRFIKIIRVNKQNF